MATCSFPAGFEWGTASASYQIEGAWNEDGKGECIWDRFSHTKGNVIDSTNGDVACDFYHRYKDDIALAKELGMQVYRLSISWPRVIPNGYGEVNQKGVAFYRDVLKCLKDNGIKAAVTLYHWDLPQALQDKGGWANREIVGWFEDYAKLIYKELGDLVDYWITFNEPICACMLGYWVGVHAPGYHDYGMALAASHNMLLSHGAAVKAYRAMGLGGEIGITINLNMEYPFDPTCEDDVFAAKLKNMESNRLYMDPVFKGEYTKELFDFLATKGVVLPKILPGDMELIKQELDFVGLNTYFPEFVQYDKSEWPIPATHRKTGLPTTDMGWEVYPEGMYDILKWMQDEYAPRKIIVTENGCASNDWVSLDGKVHDPNRREYLKLYLTQVKRAIDSGVNVAGYYEWCFCDNFEWALGLSKRFGMVYVDYKTQERIPKDSARWYAETIKNNGFEL
jgi:beta-glucosidase